MVDIYSDIRKIKEFFDFVKDIYKMTNVRRQTDILKFLK